MQDADAVSVSEAGLALAELDDAELLSMARQDNQEAYAALFTRYTYAAHRLARHLGQREEAEDVVSESFAQVLDLVRRGKGPDRAFRAYLFTTIRHESARRAKARQRVLPTDDDRQIDSVVPFGGGQLDDFEKSAIRAAYESLPDRWRTVLWHLDVEGRKPHELGPLLDLSANSVSALVYRARSGLREAYLQQHVKEQDAGGSRACRDVRDKLSTFVRRSAPSREQERVHAHLESCSECLGIYLDLKEVNREVGAIISPAALAVSVVGLTVGATVGGLAAIISQVAVMVKSLVMSLLAPAAAAALTTATVVGLSVTDVSDPPRFPRGESAESAPRVSRDAAPPAREGASGTAPVREDAVDPAPARPVLPATEVGAESTPGPGGAEEVVAAGGTPDPSSVGRVAERPGGGAGGDGPAEEGDPPAVQEVAVTRVSGLVDVDRVAGLVRSVVDGLAGR